MRRRWTVPLFHPWPAQSRRDYRHRERRDRRRADGDLRMDDKEADDPLYEAGEPQEAGGRRNPQTEVGRTSIENCPTPQGVGESETKSDEKCEQNQCSKIGMVPRRGLEPPHPFGYQHLKLARLPIPPSGRRRAMYGCDLPLSTGFLKFPCPSPKNLHGSVTEGLSSRRLPSPCGPRGRGRGPGRSCRGPAASTPWGRETRRRACAPR